MGDLEFFNKTPNLDLKPVPPNDFKKLGLPSSELKWVQEMEELRLDPPNLVIAECVKHVSFTQNQFKKQQLKKKNRYCMGLGVYQQLWYDKRQRAKILKPASVKFKNLYKPYIGQDLTNKTILVSRTGGIGDLLFIQPNLIYLKEQYPSCTINFACGPQYQSMVDNWDCIDNVLDLPFAFSYMINADYHVIFEGVIERCEQAKTNNAYELFTTWMGLDLPIEDLIPYQEAKPKTVEYCQQWLQERNIDNFIVAQLRASSPVRTPRPKLWRKLICKVVDNGHTVIITDSPSMKDVLDQFIKTFPEEYRDKVLNFSGYSQSLDYSIGLVSLADCTLSTDSAMAHIAASLDVPCFGLFGPFPARIRLSTYKKADWIEGKLECMPCWTHGAAPCPNNIDGHPRCYDTIDLDKAAGKIEGLLKND